MELSLHHLKQATIIEMVPPFHEDYLLQQKQLWQAIFCYYEENFANFQNNSNLDAENEQREDNNTTEHAINPLIHVYHLKPVIGKNEISVPQIREMTEWSIGIPAITIKNVPNHKWVIIETVEQLTINAANCLLKILEEPPEFLSFLLITSQLETILPTIRSRCHVLRYGDQTDYLIIKSTTASTTLELPEKSINVCSWVKKNKPVYHELVKQLQKIAIAQCGELLFLNKTESTIQQKKWLHFYRQLLIDCENIRFFNQGSLSKELSCEQLLFKYCEVFE